MKPAKDAIAEPVDYGFLRNGYEMLRISRDPRHSNELLAAPRKSPPGWCSLMMKQSGSEEILCE